MVRGGIIVIEVPCNENFVATVERGVLQRDRMKGGAYVVKTAANHEGMGSNLRVPIAEILQLYCISISDRRYRLEVKEYL